MSDQTKTTISRPRTRFACLWEDGSMSVMPCDHDYARAARELIGGTGDDEIELVEVEVTVLRSFGRPRMRLVQQHVECPTCGEHIAFDVEKEPVHVQP